MANTVQEARRDGRRQQTRCTPAMLARIRDWIEREISFVTNPKFSDPDFAATLAGQRPQSLEQRTQEPFEPGVAFVTGLVNEPLLTHPEEIYLFKQMNFLRFRAEHARQQLNLNSPNPSLVDRIEEDLREAVEVRNQIVRSNLRLVVSLARQFTGSTDDMGELIGEACVPLIRAVELFDVQLGNRFSTYATWAVRNHMIRCLKKRQSQQGQRIPCDQVWFDRLPDHRSNPEDDNREIAHRTELVQSLLNLLDERERQVITARFGLDGEPRGQSLQDIAERVGLSKERVRQIVLAGVRKLQMHLNPGEEAWLA
jgi:RNA polymerase sigma factor (sigma-70 family)